MSVRNAPLRITPVPLLAAAALLLAPGCGSDSSGDRPATAPSAARPEPALPPVTPEALARIEARLVRIPAGTLPAKQLSRDRKRPETKVDGFWLGKYEVTRQEWADVMGGDPAGDPGLPVTSVSWRDAHRFADRLNQAKGADVFRLPTAAEWELACRAGEMGHVAAQSSEASLKQVAWLRYNSGGRPHPVGRLKPNAFGLFDMLGNVSEWCEDPFSPDQTDSRRVTAGANFEEDIGSGRDCHTQAYLSGEYREEWLGFRLARTATASSPKAKAAAPR